MANKSQREVLGTTELLQNILLHLDRSALEWLATEGYDPIYGARPLKRVIQRALQNPLASRLLEGGLHDGSTVLVTAGTDGLKIGETEARSEL